jgi:RNA polymerase sigma-70 factor (family 1)
MPKQSVYTDQELMEAFRLGREDAFAQIFRDLYPALCYYGRQVTGDQAAAEDIVSGSFLKVWEKRALFQQRNALKSYLYTIVKNAAIDWLRKEGRLENSGREYIAGTQEEERFVLENIIEAELLREIYAAIDKLPVQCRKVIEMIYVEGKSTSQIAADLQLSVSSIRNQKARGLGILRKIVQLPLLIVPVLLFV